MDGVAARDFDMIDAFIARYHIDLEVAPQAMAMPSLEVARMLVDMSVPRQELVRLAHGMTPAKLAEVVASSSLEIAFAYGKMRARRTPGNQAHVTNAKDDPLQMAADAATAVAFGFDEIETTMRVASQLLVECRGVRGRRCPSGGGAHCSSARARKRKSSRSAWPASRPMPRRSRSTGPRRASWTATTRHGRRRSWPRPMPRAASRCGALRSRLRVADGLSREQVAPLSSKRAACACSGPWAQGTQNGGIDGAPVTCTVPGGMRELMAENLIAVWLDLECASGNDARATESEIRVGAKILSNT